MCKKQLKEKRVLDHDHTTGGFKGAIQPYSNFNFKQSKTISVAFNNLKKYHGHHLMTELGEHQGYKINKIAATLK